MVTVNQLISDVKQSRRGREKRRQSVADVLSAIEGKKNIDRGVLYARGLNILLGMDKKDLIHFLTDTDEIAMVGLKGGI